MFSRVTDRDEHQNKDYFEPVMKDQINELTNDSAHEMFQPKLPGSRAAVFSKQMPPDFLNDFEIGGGDRVIDYNSQIKLIVSSHRGDTRSLDQEEQTKLQQIQKYKKFEKINMKSKVICQQSQGHDGYRIETDSPPKEP